MASGRSPHHLVGNRPTSWFEPAHAGWANGWSASSVVSTIRAQGLGVQVGEDEREVEAQVELVAGRTVEAGDLPEVEDPGLADQDPRRIERVGDPAPVAVDLVHLGAVHVVDLALAAAADVLGIVVRRGGVVAQLAVLDETVRHVDAEPRDPPIEPEPEDAPRTRGARPRSTSRGPAAPPGSCAGSTGRSARRAPTPARRTPSASCWAASRRAAGRARRTIPGARRPGTTERRRTTGGGRWCGSARGRGSPGCLGTPRPRPADRASPGRRAPDGRRGSPRRRTPNPDPGTA